MRGQCCNYWPKKTRRTRRSLADLMGVRRDGQGLMIAAKHRGLARALARSKWGNADLRKLLLQLDMTVLTAHPQRFGGLRERAVRIPQATLSGNGRGV